MVVDSVAGVKVGDIVDFVHSTSHVYKKVTEIDESAKKIIFADAFGSAAHVDNDVVNVSVSGFAYTKRASPGS